MQIQPIRRNICKSYSNRVCQVGERGGVILPHQGSRLTNDRLVFMVCQVGERGGVILPHQGSRLTNDRLVFMLMLVDAPAHTKVGAKYKS